MSMSFKKLVTGKFQSASLVNMKRPSSPPQRRKRAGAWLKGLREEAGLTQLELASRLGFKYYAFVSQVETGLSRVPAGKMEVWAQAVGMEPRRFVQRLLAFYEPELHRVLYEGESCSLERSE
jgi:transcriptional regulator with XRE-family HTH domain